MSEQMIKVGITHGDINGIGYEVILKAFGDSRLAELCTPVVYGSSKIAALHRKAMDLPPVNLSQISKAEDAGANRVNIINCVADDLKIEIGQSTEVGGRAAFDALEAAVKDLKRGVIDVLLTAPINKANIQNESFHFPGHTEYLEEHFAKEEQKALMILMTQNIRVALVTGHIPLAQVAPTLKQEDIITKLILFNQSLKRDFGIIKPRIAVLSLNPHAGDAGLLGNEEQEIIIPAMKEAEKNDVMSFGPYAADGFFGSQMYEAFDGVLAMYHDQGLAPFKTLAMEEGVNYTAGLSIVRTSPAHGTAYDIAGQNKASEESFRQALYAALDIFRNRKTYKEATANPLRRQYFDKGGDNVKLDLTKDDETDSVSFPG
ncbi:4-hydroxythreonine-4-phosphate dehydrogenase PdxA [Parabacteroides sp. OttesenSCG-928-G06]|nr:4-hydroxythreonine-4-phosphate dehydrogenase PdxA [Parabacteroides sp. OttesenSCG-928-K15]MDL2282062.1 4-hydroxythreonine-4-phosphate dehydrogenase PdxA [Parabacteroides sp. OttesenSCG-928-G06]